MEGYFTTSGKTPKPENTATPSSSQIDEASAILETLRAALEKQQATSDVADGIAKADVADKPERAEVDRVDTVAEETGPDQIDEITQEAETAEAKADESAKANDVITEVEKADVHSESEANDLAAKIDDAIPSPPAADSTEGVIIAAPPASAASATTTANTSMKGNAATQAPIDAYFNQTTTDDAGTINAYTAIQEQRKKKRRGHIIRGIVAAGVVTALLGAGVWWAQQQNQAAEDAPVVETDVVSHGDFATVVSANGTIRPLSSSEVTPEVDGIITDVNVAEGDYVQQGDILFVIKNETLDKTLVDAKSGVEAAQKQVDSAGQTLENATNNYNRIMQTQYASQEEADTAGEAAQQAYDSAKDEAEAANKTLTQAKATLKEAEDLANKRIVMAPCDGTIITLNAKNGAAVGGAPGGTGERVASGSLATIGDLSQLRVSVQVNEVDISDVAVGQDAKVTFSALNDLELPATVEHIAAVSGSSSGEQETAGTGIVTYDVDLLIANPDPRVKPGMTARVEITTQSITDVMMVPTAALVDNGDGTWAITVVDEAKNTTISRPVEVLAKNASMAAISGNVTQGDVVQIVLDSTDDESMSSEVIG